MVTIAFVAPKPMAIIKVIQEPCVVSVPFCKEVTYETPGVDEGSLGSNLLKCCGKRGKEPNRTSGRSEAVWKMM